MVADNEEYHFYCDVIWWEGGNNNNLPTKTNNLIMISSERDPVVFQTCVWV